MKQNKIISLVIISLMLMSLFASFGVAQTNYSNYTNATRTSGPTILQYPTYFTNKPSTLIVVGDNAPSSDVTAAVDITLGLSAQGIILPTSSARVASDISDITQYDSIIVGNACTNPISARFFGNPVNCWSAVPEGKAMIKLVLHSTGKIALIVAGGNKEDTKKAATFLAQQRALSIYEASPLIIDTATIQPPVPTQPTYPPIDRIYSGSGSLPENGEAIYVFNGKEYDVEVLVISETANNGQGSVKFRVNGQITIELSEGQSQTLADGTYLLVNDIGISTTSTMSSKVSFMISQAVPQLQPPRFAAISGNKASYNPSETIFWPVKAVEPDGTPASFEEGYYIQFYTHNTATGQRVDSIVNKGQYNAEYNSNDGYWYVKFEAPETADKYYTTLTLYCSRENTKCYNTYGHGPEWKKNVDFYVSGTSGVTQCKDTDGGLNPFVRGKTGGAPYGYDKQIGIIWGEDSPNKCSARSDPSLGYSVAYDCCSDNSVNKQLNEALCENGLMQTRAVQCEFGCSNGACVQQTTSTLPKLFIGVGDNYPTETVIPAGATSYVFLSLKFAAPQTHDVMINEIAIADLVNGVPAISDDLRNFVLFASDGYQVGSVIRSISPPIVPNVGVSPTATFKNLNWIIPKGQSRILYLHADTSPTASTRKHALRLDGFTANTHPSTVGLDTNWHEVFQKTGRTFVIGTQFVAPPTSTMQIYTDKLEYAENEPVSIRTIMPTLMNCENYFVSEYGQEFKRSYGGCPIDGQSYSGPAPGLGVWKAKVVAWYPEKYIVLHPGTPTEKFTLYSKQFTVGQTRLPITIGQSRIERLNNLEVIGKFYLDSGLSFVSNGAEYSFNALTISQPDRVAKLTINGEIIKLKEGEKQRIANGAIFYLEEVLPTNIDFRLVTPSVVTLPTVEMRCEARGSLSLSREMEECIGNSISETERRLIDDNCEDILSGNPAFRGCNRGQKDFEIVECAKQKFPQTAERLNKCISGQQERRCESRQSIQIEGTELGNCLERVFDGADQSQIRRCNNDVFKRMPTYSGCDDNQIAPLVINCARELMPQLNNGINNCFRQAQVPLIVPPAPAMPGVQPPVPPVIVQPPIQQRRECNGCEVNNRCLSFGIRLVGENGVPSYCDWDKTFKAQKTESQACQNNYECVSNSCSSGQCKTVEDRRGIEAERLEAIERQLKEQQSILERILGFFKRLFGG